MTQREALQTLARKYLRKLIPDAKDIGLEKEIQNIIKDNEDGRCEAKKKQVDKLARILEDGNIIYCDIPDLVGKSYRSLFENDLVSKFVRKFKKQGQYSRVDAMLLKDKLKNKK